MTPISPTLDLSDIEAVKPIVADFKVSLAAVKANAAPADFPWYPYDTLANVWHLADTLTGSNRSIYQDMRGKRVADIGAADGDMAFFCEQLGATVDIIDNAPTNMNGLEGAERVKQVLNSKVGIHHLDLDEYFELPAKYDLVIFMGILYHLQNPYYVLSYLARNVKRMVFSNKIANHPPRSCALAGDPSYDQVPLAYLLDAMESNNDPTNYWVFSDAGMKRLFDRTGWYILDYRSTTPEARTDPVDPAADQRVFCYLESKVFDT